MTSALDRIADARRAGDPRRLAELVPYARFMGISFDLASRVLGGAHPDSELIGTMAYAGTLIGDPGVPALHGGALGALLESTAIFQLLWSSEMATAPRTINITVEYLRPGQPADTFARGIITRRGRRVANVRVEAWQRAPEQPIAIALAHFLIQPDA